MKLSKKITIKNWTPLLWVAVALLLVAMLFARAVFGEHTWLTVVVAVLLAATFGALLQQNRRALRSRTAAFGLNSAVTVVLVVGIVGVINFLGSRYTKKWDLTAAGLHTLSDQTVKAVKALKQPVQAVIWAKAAERERFQPLLDRYKAVSTQFQIELVDPDQSPLRARDAGIKRYGTVQLKYAGRESKLEDLTEEKLTNALIKLTRDRTIGICAITGHGEKSLSGGTADGFDALKKGLEEQSYTVRDFSLVSDLKDGQIPDTCDALLLLGPNKPLFAAEIQVLRKHLSNGGRLVVSADMPLKGADPMAELAPVLAQWNLRVVTGLILDPSSRMLGSDASVPVVVTVNTFNPDHAITKEFKTRAVFPFSRPIEVMGGAPTGIAASWIAQSSASSVLITNLKELATGQVRLQPGKDVPRSFQVAAAVEGKFKEAKLDARKTRIVVFGSAQVANNQWSRFGGNLDLFLNAVSWAAEDDSLISIRSKEDSSGRIELSARAGGVIGILTLVILPLLISGIGIGVWYFRRRM